jgi:phosphoadenosine phosphosulfate reductase
MGNASNQKKQFERWPKYRELYLKAFDRMIKIRKERGLNIDKCETPESVMKWWLGEGEQK